MSARASTAAVLGPLLIPDPAQQRDTPPAHKNEHIPVRAVHYRVWLQRAPGQGVLAMHQLWARACTQRRPYTLDIAEHVHEKLLKLAFTYRRVPTRAFACRT